LRPVYQKKKLLFYFIARFYKSLNFVHNISIKNKIKDGDKISPGIAIAYLMFKKNLNLTIASLSVFQKRSCVEIEKWIYTQLLNYIPNLKEKEKK